MHIARLFIITSLMAFSCAENANRHANIHWVVKGEVLAADPENPLENVAVKDPTMLFYGGRYHLFYTAKSKSQGARGDVYGIGCGYRSAESIEGLGSAPRISVDAMAGTPVIAPQVFYFEPQQRWYLVAHTPAPGSGLNKLEPVCLTNPDIMDPEGWSEARVIKTGKTDEGFWIDFWVICDDLHAYLFYADQTGKLFRLQCAIDDFPEGFTACSPELALEVNRMDQPDGWRFFEAAHIYHVASADLYLALLEGAYAHPSRMGDVDSRNRFVFGMVADSLNGEWRRLENDENTFLADARNISYGDGQPVSFTQVSHPELIRSGYDQRLEIESFKMKMLFQTFDGSVVPDNYNYNALPWRLMLMNNFE
jgi:endo-1,4-beta-xylanase